MTFAVKPGQDLPPLNRAVQDVRRKYPLDTMKIKEILFVPDKTTAGFSTYVHTQGRKLNRKFRTQTANMRQDLQTEEWELCKAGAPGSRRGVAVQRIA